MNDSEIKTSNNPVKWITACPLAGGSRWLHRQPALTPKYGPDRLRSRPIPDNLSHGLSPNTGLILSPQFSPFPADLQKNHHIGWNKWWQNRHTNCHQNWWLFHHLNYHRFRQIPKKITLWGETKSDKIVTWIFTKYGDHTITLIITNSGRSPQKSP